MEPLAGDSPPGAEGNTKKAPGDLTPRGQCPSFDDQSTVVQMSSEREWENRREKSWTPAVLRPLTGKKKAAGNAAHQQGDECVEGAGLPATPPSSISQQRRGHRLRTAKKMGVFPKHPRVRRIAPSPKKHPNDDVRLSDWSSPSRQNEGCGQQAKKKTGFPRSSPRHHSRPRRYGSTQRPTDGEHIPAVCLEHRFASTGESVSGFIDANSETPIL